MDFSIIIVSFNTKSLIYDCIRAIFNSSTDELFEIIVVDNASIDGSTSFLKEKFGDKIKIIKNSKNVGFGAANNQAAKQAQGDFLFFLNSDTVLHANILIGVKNFLNSNKQTACVSPRLVLPNKETQPHTYGKFPTLSSVFLKKKGRCSQIEKYPFSVDWVSGAALIISKKVFKKLSGFDEGLFMYFEDIDLCKRIGDMGYKIFVLPGIAVSHMVAQSSENKRRVKIMYYRSQNYFFKKHYGLVSAVFLRILRFPYLIIRLLKS